MSLLQLPEIQALVPPDCAQYDLRQDALEKWNPEVQAAALGDATITIYGPIGPNGDGTGPTDSRIAAALRSIGNREVTVSINSPGGNYFHGVAIYNLLRQHPAKVHVEVVGLAASAASVIAMAGDTIKMGAGSSLMIHNAWVLAAGNKHDLRSAADRLDPFDASMAELYAARCGLPVAEIAALMDAETFIGPQQAVDIGMATGLLAPAAVRTAPGGKGNTKAMALVDAALARYGVKHEARREVFHSLLSATPTAGKSPVTPTADGGGATPTAGAFAEVAASLQSLLTSLKGNHE